jgi:cell division protein FtsW
MSIRLKSHKPDYFLLLVVLFLVAMGILLINGASMVIAEKKFGSSYYYAWHQIINGCVGGIIGLIILSRINYTVLKKYSVVFYIASLVALGAVFLPVVGVSFGGASRWLKLGPLPSFQPSELLKLSSILYFAAWLESRGKKIDSLKEGFIPFLMLVFVTVVSLVFQPDIGTLGVICLGLLAMFFAAGAPKKYIITLIVLGIIAVLVLIWTSGYRSNRLTTFLDPESDPTGRSYQIQQALIGIGSGGVTGLGFGYSRQKFYYLPEAVGDSIFSIIAEEFGFIGVCIIISFYVVLIFRIFRVARNATDDFGRYVAVGVGSFWGIQALINIAAISGAIPLTGVPLPFISYGGTSLMVALFGVGIVLNISKHSEKY